MCPSQGGCRGFSLECSMLRDMELAGFGFVLKLRMRFTTFFNLNIKIYTIFMASGSSRRLLLG